jgi:hypothetical protein
MALNKIPRNKQVLCNCVCRRSEELFCLENGSLLLSCSLICDTTIVDPRTAELWRWLIEFVCYQCEGEVSSAQLLPIIELINTIHILTNPHVYNSCTVLTEVEHHAPMQYSFVTTWKARHEHLVILRDIATLFHGLKFLTEFRSHQLYYYQTVGTFNLFVQSCGPSN